MPRDQIELAKTPERTLEPLIFQPGKNGLVLDMLKCGITPITFMEIKMIGFTQTWIDTPLATEMLFGFAATTLIAICLLRYLKTHPHHGE